MTMQWYQKECLSPSKEQEILEQAVPKLNSDPIQSNANFGINEIDESEFIKRMLKVYDDKNFDDPVFTQALNEGSVRANRHAAALVISCIIKIYEKTIALCKEALQAKQKLELQIKRVYVICARVYIADFVLYMSMKADENDFFYQDISSSDW